MKRTFFLHLLRLLCTSLLVLFRFVSFLPRAEAELTAVLPRDRDPSRIRIAQFQFYGRLKGHQVINASAVVLQGRDLCSPRKGTIVKDREFISQSENKSPTNPLLKRIPSHLPK